MKPPRPLLRAALCLALSLPLCAAADGAVEPENYADLGRVEIVRPQTAARDLVFLIDDAGTGSLAQPLAAQGHLVAHIRLQEFLGNIKRGHADCVNAVTLLDVYSQHVQEKYRFARYQRPVLIGVGAGAALVYGTLAQAPGGLFRAGIGVDFCPELALPAPLCRSESASGWDDLGKGRYRLHPQSRLNTPWFTVDTAPGACPAAAPFRSPADAAPIPAGAVAGRIDQLLTPPRSPVAAPAVDQLPLVELPAAGRGDFFAVLLSGDGGWADIDQDIGNLLSSQGIPVVGWNTLKYFWNRKTPEQAAADLENVIRHYQAVWNKPKVVVIGFSLGADVLPFMLSRLTPVQRAQIRSVSLLSLSHNVDFQFHVTNWLTHSGEDNYRIAPEMKKLGDLSILCLYGKDDDDTLCPELKAANIRVQALPGDHHFDGDYQRAARLILDAARPGQNGAAAPH